jgi:hypothetical protein
MCRSYIHASWFSSSDNEFELWLERGSAVAQAVSRWLPTEAAQVRAEVRSCGIYGGQSGGWGTFSSSTSVYSANLYSTKFSILTIARDNRPEVADVPSGLNLTPIIIKK